MIQKGYMFALFNYQFLSKFWVFPVNEFLEMLLLVNFFNFQK